MISRGIIFAVALAISILVSALFSYKTYNTDFPVYYYVASTILDPQASNEDIYRYTEDRENKYSIPEKKEAREFFLYSVPVAYFLAPLALMPYYTAKATMIFLNMVAYLFAVAMILKLANASSREIAWGTAISCLWLPFLHTLAYAQVNALILLLVALAVFAVTKGHPYLCGVLIACAALFKLFPLAVALVLGLRNWRVWVGFSVLFGASLLTPGSMKWLSTLSNFVRDDATYATYATHLWLRQIHPVLVFAYPLLIGAVTVSNTLLAKDDDYPLLAAFAIPAVFLGMPRLEYYHLTLLVFTYGYLFASKKHRSLPLMGFLFVSAVVLGFPRPGTASPWILDPIPLFLYFTLLSLWVVIALLISIRSFSRNPPRMA